MAKWELIGEVGVDSGQLMITDPCYIDSLWTEKEFSEGEPNGEYSYDGCSKATCSEKGFGELNFPAGHNGAAVVFGSGYGDGLYSVLARKNEDGRIVEVRIVME